MTLCLCVTVLFFSNQITLHQHLNGHVIGWKDVEKVVRNVWRSEVETHQAGLSGPKVKGKPPPLTQEEISHHIHSSQNGIVDSARLALAFALAPAAIAATALTPLHNAAVLGHIHRIKEITENSFQVDVINEEARIGMGTTPLAAAVMMGQEKSVEVLLELGASIESKGSHGLTPLMIAAILGNARMVEKLLDHGVEVNAIHPFSHNTALHFAAEMGHVHIIDLLCNRGANPNSRKVNGGTPLHTAADCDQSKAVEALIACGSDVDLLINGDTTALYLAAQRGHEAVVQVLLEHTRKIDFQMPATGGSGYLVPHSGLGKVPEYFASLNINDEMGNGVTALHSAAENGHPNTVRLLLEGGASPHVHSNDGSTPLHVAAQYNQYQIVRIMLAHGADVNVRNIVNANTPLHDASGLGRERAAKVLLQSSANCNVRNANGVAPIHLAAFHAFGDVMATLLSAKCDPNILSNAHETALLTATIQGHVSIVRMLVESGAALDIGNSDNVTPLLEACQHKSHKTATALTKILVTAGANVNSRIQSTGATPLIAAAKMGCLECVNILISHGADLTAAATEWKATALYFAAQNGHHQIVQRLLDANSDPMSTTSSGTTPLFIACERDRLDVVNTFLSHYSFSRSLLTVRNQHGLFPIHAAAVSGSISIVRRLIEAGCDIDTVTTSGDTPLIVATIHSRGDLVKDLLARGADCSRRNRSGWNALEAARRFNKPQMLVILGKVSKCLAEEHSEL